MGGFLIGEVAERVGVTAPTIRYYESLGLITPPGRSTAGYRRYSDTTVDELRFIRKAQGLGFSLVEVGEILALTRAGKAPCSRVLSLGRQHLAAVDDRIGRLQRFRELLQLEIDKWERQREAVTDGGLCRFIADADDETVVPDSVELAPDVRPSAAKAARKARP